MESPKKTSQQLIDFNNTDQYSVRTLKYICQKNNIKIPLWPDKPKLISAISDHQKYLDLKQAEEQKKQEALNKRRTRSPNSQFNTPVLPMNLKNCSDNTFPTPIVSSKRVESQLPDNAYTIYTPIPHQSPKLGSVSAEERYLKLQQKKQKGNTKTYFIIAFLICFVLLIILIMKA